MEGTPARPKRTLRRLEFNGLVERRAYAEAPPRVEDALTELGRTLLGPIEAFGEWAFEPAEDVMAAQDHWNPASRNTFLNSVLLSNYSG